nr:MoxR family ATPase [Dactylosporangium thailandense]
MVTNEWRLFVGAAEPHDSIDRLPPPPNWRNFDERADDRLYGVDPSSGRRLGQSGVVRRYSDDDLRVINAAIYLRRPLLVSGEPGAGKSALADAIARELKLGVVLRWQISSRTTARDGLYEYDAIGRLHDENLNQLRYRYHGDVPQPLDIGRYVRLGPLGTALLPRTRPRVLLIDEIDKGDIDLPNDLLHVFEEGMFEIPELSRLPESEQLVEVMTADEYGRAPVRRGRVHCQAFPIVILTSNREREFPPAFLRRCIRLDLQPPSAQELSDMVAAHFSVGRAHEARNLVEQFLRRRTQAELASDQLLGLVYLAAYGRSESAYGWNSLIDAVLRGLVESRDA